MRAASNRFEFAFKTNYYCYQLYPKNINLSWFYHSPLLEKSHLRPPVALGVSFQPFKRIQNPMQADSKTTHMEAKWLFLLNRVRTRCLCLQIIIYSSTTPTECCDFIEIPESFKEVIYRLRALHFKDFYASKHHDFL